MEEKTRLKKIRQRKGISQRELARRIGIHHTSISKYESGVSMTDDVIKKICKALETNADYFLKLSNEEKRGD